jgi:hypothetical protein
MLILPVLAIAAGASEFAGHSKASFDASAETAWTDPMIRAEFDFRYHHGDGTPSNRAFAMSSFVSSTSYRRSPP